MSAPGESALASTFTGLTVVIERTLPRNAITSVRRGAPGSSIDKRSAGAAVVVRLTACWNVHARLRAFAPALIRRTDASSGLAVVARGLRAIDWETVASIRQTAVTGSIFEGQTVATVIVSLTTDRNLDALFLSDAPRESILANAFSGGTIVAVRAIDWDDVALIIRGAPGSARVKCKAFSAIIAGLTARRDINTRVLSRAPSLVARTSALPSLAVVGCDIRAVLGNIITGISLGTPAKSGIKCQTVSAVVAGGTARGDLNAIVLSSAPSISTLANTLPGRAVVACRTVLRNVIALIR